MSALVAICAALAAMGTAHLLVNVVLLRRPPSPAPAPALRVSVLLPVRDEAGRVGPCLRALLAQEGVAELIVLDDSSTDDTVTVVESILDGHPHARLLRGTPVPQGWLGKPHACAQLADAATGEVLVFVDADTELAPGAVAACVAMLDEYRLDLVSPYPRQVTGSVGERLVQPLLQWSWLTFLPLRLAERSPRPSLSAANGQLLAVRTATYRAAGGHAAIRGEVLDDIALLRAVKAVGGRGGVVDGSALASCRMYTSWREVADGYGKSLWSAFGSTAGAVAVLALLLAAYVVPPVAALAGSWIGLAGYATGVTGRVAAAWRTRGRMWPDALLHPVSIVLFCYLTARSLWLRRTGRLSWKDRPISTVGSGG